MRNKEVVATLAFRAQNYLFRVEDRLVKTKHWEFFEFLNFIGEFEENRNDLGLSIQSKWDFHSQNMHDSLVFHQTGQSNSLSGVFMSSNQHLVSMKDGMKSQKRREVVILLELKQANFV